MENNVGDLWSLMGFLNPGFLGNQQEFRKRFFMPIQIGRHPEAVTRLKPLPLPSSCAASRQIRPSFPTSPTRWK